LKYQDFWLREALRFGTDSEQGEQTAPKSAQKTAHGIRHLFWPIQCSKRLSLDPFESFWPLSN
jgi:hypothetical protein